MAYLVVCSHPYNLKNHTRGSKVISQKSGVYELRSKLQLWEEIHRYDKTFVVVRTSEREKNGNSDNLVLDLSQNLLFKYRQLASFCMIHNS